MKRLFGLMSIIILLLSSCVTFQSSNKPVIENLPVVQKLEATGSIRSVNLSWMPVGDPRVEGYIIYRASDNRGDFKKLATINGRFKASYLDDGGFLKHLDDNTDYFYKIAVYSSKGIGPASVIAIGHTAPKPDSPTDITAKSGLPRMVVIKWKPVMDKSVVAYDIYRSLSEKGPFKKIGKVNGHVNTFFVDKGLKDETTYYYSVVSVNYKGVDGRILAYAKATTKKRPLPPTKLSGKIAGAGKLQIAWWPSPTSDVVKYKIYRGISPDYLNSIGSVNSSKLTFIDKDLQPGFTYYYKVNSVDKDGIESDSTQIVPIKTKPLPLPPKGISVRQLNDGSVLLDWDKGSDDTVGYEVFRRYYIIIAKKIADTSDTKYVDKNVSKNTTYYYWVKSVDQYGQESKSSPVAIIKTQ